MLVNAVLQNILIRAHMSRSACTNVTETSLTQRSIAFSFIQPKVCIKIRRKGTIFASHPICQCASWSIALKNVYNNRNQIAYGNVTCSAMNMHQISPLQVLSFSGWRGTCRRMSEHRHQLFMISFCKNLQNAHYLEPSKIERPKNLEGNASKSKLRLELPR